MIVGGITVNSAKDMRHLKKLIAKQAAFEENKDLECEPDLRKLVSKLELTKNRPEATWAVFYLPKKSVHFMLSKR